MCSGSTIAVYDKIRNTFMGELDKLLGGGGGGEGGEGGAGLKSLVLNNFERTGIVLQCENRDRYDYKD